MNYVNAGAVLPDYLLKEIQQYVQGEIIYIPTLKGVRKKWGAETGYREYLEVRNREIRECFLNGRKIEQIANEYSLSIESIKKIVYKK